MEYSLFSRCRGRDWTRRGLCLLAMSALLYTNPQVPSIWQCKSLFSCHSQLHYPLMLANKLLFSCVGSRIPSGISLRNWIQLSKGKRLCQQDRVLLVTLLLFSSIISIFHGKKYCNQALLCVQAPAKSKLRHRQGHVRSLQSWYPLSDNTTSQDAQSPRRKRKTVNSSDDASNLGLLVVLLLNTAVKRVVHSSSR